MPKIQITSKGIRSALKKYNAYQSIAEYVWNGFDAKAQTIKIDYVSNEIGNVDLLTISDDGYGIPHDKLQEKFEPLFESKKALENKLKKNLSAIHGKNGIGRLTFFTFARNATWKTVYEQNETNLSYEIYANSENINLYTGINAVPRLSSEPCGTTVTFSGIFGLISQQLEEKFQDFILKEFSWFLALNANKNFNIIINGIPIDYKNIVADSEKTELIHEPTNTVFFLSYIRWNQKLNNEQSRYYYLNSKSDEKWKEPTAIKNKGEQFYHSIFVQSPYFDSFGFQSIVAEKQEALIAGTRSDAQFKFLRKKLANILRIKRRPFLRGFAEQLLIEYEQKKIMQQTASEQLKQTIKTLYEMQPKIFTSLNSEQKKILVGFLDMLIQSDQKSSIADFIATTIDLTPNELSELKEILN